MYGQPQRDWRAAPAGVDLAAIENGGYLVAANNQHFGPASQMLMPGRGVNMGDGWETRRRRGGNDWAIVALARPGIIRRVEVDTAFFKGNFPDRCSLQAARVAGGTDDSLVTQAMFWAELLGEQKLQMDHVHTFDQLAALGPVTHVRFNIFPDGGVSRLRLWGEPAKEGNGMSESRILRVERLTREAFAPFGDVIALEGARHFPINGGTTERFHDLATIDVCADGGRPLVSVFRAQRARCRSRSR